MVWQGTQSLWKYCSQCQGLFYDGLPHKGWCHAGGRHDSSGSFNFILAYEGM